jgi:hypothetical protein
MNDDCRDLVHEIKAAFRQTDQKKPSLAAHFNTTRYAGILLLATCLEIYQKYTLKFEGNTCCNLYRLGIVAKDHQMEYDRGKQAIKIYQELEKNDEVRRFLEDNKTYVCLTDKGRRELHKKVEELLKLNEYRSPQQLSSLPTSPSEALRQPFQSVKVKDETPLDEDREKTRAEDKQETKNKRKYQKILRNRKILFPVVGSAVTIIAVIAFFAFQPQSPSQHPLKIMVNIIGSQRGSHPAQVELSTVNGLSRNETFNLTGSNQTIPILVPRGMIHNGEPFKVCVSVLDTHNRNCVIGLNHPSNRPETVPLKAPSDAIYFDVTKP